MTCKIDRVGTDQVGNGLDGNRIGLELIGWALELSSSLNLYPVDLLNEKTVKHYIKKERAIG